jgi:hypothetical protein
MHFSSAVPTVQTQKPCSNIVFYLVFLSTKAHPATHKHFFSTFLSINRKASLTKAKRKRVANRLTHPFLLLHHQARLTDTRHQQPNLTSHYHQTMQGSTENLNSIVNITVIQQQCDNKPVTPAVADRLACRAKLREAQIRFKDARAGVREAAKNLRVAKLVRRATHSPRFIAHVPDWYFWILDYLCRR